MVKYKNSKKEEKIKLKPEERIKLKPKEKLIKYLIENKEPHSILSLSGSAVVDYKNTYNIIGNLQASGAVIVEKVGNTKPVRLNLVPNQEIYLVESKRTKDFLSRNPKLKIVQRYVEDLNYPFLIVLIFGSYAKNTKTKRSDIDLCVISDNLDKTRELNGRLRLLSLKLEIHEFTTKEFISMIEKNQNNLGHEIIKNNLLLCGIENYYNLISKWMKKE